MSAFVSRPRRSFLRWMAVGTGVFLGSEISVANAATADAPDRENLQRKENPETLFIERECQRLCINYAKTIDARKLDEFTDLFASDIEVILGTQHFHTREEFVKVIRNRPKERVSAHTCTNIFIDVIDKTNASGICYLTLFRADCEVGAKSDSKILYPRMVGIYHDRYKKIDGRWKFVSRILQPLMSVDSDMKNVCP